MTTRRTACPPRFSFIAMSEGLAVSGAAEGVADVACAVAVSVLSFLAETADVLVAVEAAVRTTDVDEDIRVLPSHALDRFGSGENGCERDDVGATHLEDLHRVTRRSAGREHGVDDEAVDPPESGNELGPGALVEVDRRDGRFLIASEPE